MPKTTNVGRFRRTAESVKSSKDPPSTSLSRGQRKRQAKRQQYLQKERLVMSTLLLQKQEEQKKRIDGLDALREALMGVSEEKEKSKKEKSTRVETNHAKKEVAAREVNHMDLVLQHPSFKTDPYGTIQMHLKNTLNDQAKKLTTQSKERAKQDEVLAAAKKEKRAERRTAQGGKHRKNFRTTRRSKR